MSRREPYRSFLKLPIRSKLAFFRRLVKDRRVPWWVKAAPFALVLYLALPFDLAPDFIPVLGYLDDVGAGAAHLGLCDALHPSGRSAGADEGSGHSPGVGEVETKPKP
ncbi:MAG: DUF1232 domain-containing protein [Chloroflexi bacterium]|nr:DUF1232 domain-containing protein [Chloroflexota bacterium]